MRITLVVLSVVSVLALLLLHFNPVDMWWAGSSLSRDSVFSIALLAAHVCVILYLAIAFKRDRELSVQVEDNGSVYLNHLIAFAFFIYCLALHSKNSFGDPLLPLEQFNPGHTSPLTNAVLLLFIKLGSGLFNSPEWGLNFIFAALGYIWVLGCCVLFRDWFGRAGLLLAVGIGWSVFGSQFAGLP